MSKNSIAGERFDGVPGYLHYAGFRYWTASIFPTLVGTTLPFWLRPPDFSFRWVAAIEFLFAVVSFHAGFSFLLEWLQKGAAPSRPKSRLLSYSIVCIAIACLLGFVLNRNLTLHPGVPEYIFVVYGLTALFIGALYVIPPFSLFRRFGGEIVIAEGLGMIPLLGAYLVQVGDLTRTVYVASLPLVVMTGLWVWVEEMGSRSDDEKSGRNTMVIEFGPRFSGRYGVPGLCILFYATIFIAVFSGALSILTLISLLLAGLFWKIVIISRNEYSHPERMLKTKNIVFILHLLTGSILAVSSLIPMFIK